MSFAEKAKYVYLKVADKLSGKRVVFHHLPRCGGTSVARALRMRYFLSQTSINAACSYETIKRLGFCNSKSEIIMKTKDFREMLLFYYLHSDIHWINGHVRFSIAAYEDFNTIYKFVTVLREPVSRFISDYFGNYGKQKYSGTELSIREYLECYEGKMQSNCYSEYFSGLPINSEFGTTLAIDKAKENLDKLDLVGFTNNLDLFANKISSLLGVKVKIGHENTGKVLKNARNMTITPEIKEKITEVCKGDIEIYDYALQRFGKL